MSYPIPDSALDDRLGFVGTSGSGKTYAAGTAVERLLKTGARVVIVDPLGAWWGLRLLSQNAGIGFDLPIFGGDHGDLPLNESAGKLIGETVAGMAESCIIDLSALPSKTSERRFMIAFLDAVYRKANGSPFHMVFDEADLWAPQRSSEPKLQSLMEQIVRRGRIKGFIPWVITQRPAVISKDILSQVDGLVAMKLTASQDRKAIGDWVKAQADEGQWQAIDAALPAMPRGNGVLWLPGRGILETVAFPSKITFDSSRTPGRGEKRQSFDLRPLNLESLKTKLAAIEDEAKANDPSALKTEVSRLTRELAKAQRAIAAPPPPERIVANEADLEKARAEGVQQGIAQCQASLAALGGGKVRRSAPPAPISAIAPVSTQPPFYPISLPSAGITGPQQKVLDAIAWWSAFGIEQPTTDQVGFIAGYSPSSGGFGNLKSGLRTLGLLDYPASGKLALSDAGRDKANVPAVAPTRDAFHAAVRAKLSGPQTKVLDPAIAAYPDPIALQAVADIAGYSVISGGFGNLRSSLKTIGLIEYPHTGHIRASDWLFP